MTFAQYLGTLPLSPSERAFLHINLLLKGRHYFAVPDAVGLHYVVVSSRTRASTVGGLIGCFVLGLVFGISFGVAF